MAGIGAFWSVSFLLVLVPGADWAYAITAGLRHRSVLPAVGGMLGGYVLLTAVVAAGLATAVAGSPTALTVLTAAGAAYLIWLGATTLARPAAPRAEESENAGTGSWVGRAARGAGISGLNPKALLLFLALLPQFAARDSDWPFAAQIVALGLVHTANCAVVYAGVGTTARRILGARPAVAATVSRVSGAAMILVGALLLVERLLARH
ncbi:LysE family translocator [Streptomyces coelicoflavus]|uniref:LysE family translocator n=1 Tax=Streptomyces coelicoflavus TaxID=285562 RepID=A0A7K3PW06_9ACTN|nr:LysE family translocator [Streptomyces coelicoflavus]NEB14172.1 LysE family translocator [Streptomyces coelicoflavus]